MGDAARQEKLRRLDMPFLHQATGLAATTTFIGTLVASVAPNDFVLWSGGLATLGLGAIAIYQKWRDTRRQADIDDQKALGDSWKNRYDQARQEAEKWRSSAQESQAASQEWQRLYKAVRPDSPGGSKSCGP